MSGRGGLHLCSFQAGPDVEWRVGKGRLCQISYEEFKAAALKAGRFSCFEASENGYAASLYTRLCRDPEIETMTLGFPWTGVKKRETTP